MDVCVSGWKGKGERWGSGEERLVGILVGREKSRKRGGGVEVGRREVEVKCVVMSSKV